jgi:tetratricopeptide (TPR) repeat protein
MWFTPYNQPVVHTFTPLRLLKVWQATASAGLGLVLALSMMMAGTISARAQAASATGSAAGAADEPGRILLVLPFDNRTGQLSLEWIREAVPEILGSRFASAGFSPMSRVDRLYALDHLGLPQGFQPSHASSLKLAQTLDADSIIVGSYMTDGSDIVAEAQVVDVSQLRMSAPVTARGEMRNLMGVFNSLAWKLTRQLDPSFNVAEETFVASSAGLRLEALEQYIRGITAPDQAERLRHLKQAVQISPEFSQAWMALGREAYNSQQYEQAATAFAKVGSHHADSLEAGFYRGLALLFFGDYGKAEDAFSSVARVLPLAEVLNNQGVAASRRGRDGVALFRQAVAADANAADYHFNLAVSLKRHGERAEALTELAQCLRLRPNDSEAQELEKLWKGSVTEQATDPLERIARNFDAVAFRQAAQVMDQMNASRQAVLSPRDRAKNLAVRAKDYLDRGLLLEAERLYQAAVTADVTVAAAHAGLAEVRERTGDGAAARKEAQTALELDPSVEAYLVLARLNLAGGHLTEAGSEVHDALKLDPKNLAALELNRQIEAKGAQKK